MTSKLYFSKVNNNIDKDLFNQQLSQVSPEKQRRINQLKCDIDKKLTLYSEILVRSLICEKLGIRNCEIGFAKNKYGKPYFKDQPEFHFNISHTRDAIAVAISNDPIGVDIERIEPIKHKIANRFFSDNEQKYINNKTYETDKRFYEIWTKKEAYVKYKGKGLPLLNSAIDVFDPDISNWIQSIEKDGYIISICCKLSNRQFEIIELKESQIEALACSILQ